MKKSRNLAAFCLFFTFALFALPGRASVLGAYFFAEQVRLNHSGYAQNVIDVEMPWGERCRFSYFHHRSSHDEKRTVVIHGFLDRAITWRQAIVKIPEGSPYRKSLILIDLPHHGDSKCAGVNSFSRAETFLEIGLQAVRKRENFKVAGIWSGSLGGLFGLSLLNTYPEAQLTMIVPPLLAEPYANLKIQEIATISTREGLTSFLAKVPPANRSLPLMNSVVSGLLPRTALAQQLVKNVDGKRIWSGYQRSSHPVRIMASQDDMLLPIAEMDPRYTSNRKTIYRVVDKHCGHSILRYCADEATPFLIGDVASVADTSEHAQSSASLGAVSATQGI
ncbi:MAG TPA: hypothetical protein VM901_13620 [Bdellovibrionota bacterium]|jgi:pimeloyl-ACP methyl ester carboxylesterase|nr:hypothetical protein [Bdellovibrionota bacterium]